jgi:hypothetical protein
MAYFLELEETTVVAYLDSPERHFAPQDLDAIYTFLDVLADQGDKYRNDPSFRCSPDSSNMEIDFVFLASSGNMRQFRFIVSDAAAIHGVLRVIYVDEV